MSSPRFGTALTAVTAVLALVAAACTAASWSGTGDTSVPATSHDAGVSTSTSGAAWQRIVPGGDCQCADGSEFAFWVRPADPAKVVLFLDGGGACWDATMCAFSSADSTTYDWNVSDDDDPSLERGIFDSTDPRNPFADHTFVYVPYCTGDVHLGDATRTYAPDVNVEHKGFVNGSTALAYLAEHFSDAEQIVVAGESAGSVAAPVYGGLAADALPEARVTVLADSSGAYPHAPTRYTDVLAQWGAFQTMPDWDVNAGLTPEDWGPTSFSIQAGRHDPDIVMARFDHAFDETQAAFMDLAGLDPSNLVASIDANEATIEAAGVVQHSYTAPGADHGVVGDERFFSMEVDGVALSDWVAALLTGDPMDDVHCDDCQASPSARDTDGDPGAPAPPDSPALVAQLRALAACMRAKGYEIDDPTVNEQGHAMLEPPSAAGANEDEIEQQDRDFAGCAAEVGLDGPATTDGG